MKAKLEQEQEKPRVRERKEKKARILLRIRSQGSIALVGPALSGAHYLSMIHGHIKYFLPLLKLGQVNSLKEWSKINMAMLIQGPDNKTLSLFSCKQTIVLKNIRLEEVGSSIIRPLKIHLLNKSFTSFSSNARS